MLRAALLVSVLYLLSSAATSQAEEGDREAKVRQAVERGLAVVTRGAKNYPEHRKCFSCHHQTLPLMAMSLAGACGYKVDSDVIDAQVKFTQAFFAGRKESLDRGERIGGAAATLSYGLWTYEIAKAKPDEVTDTLVASLIKLQESDGSWRPPSHRPPLEESQVTCTVLAGYSLQTFGRGEHREAVDSAIAKATKWLEDARLESTEDYASMLVWYSSFAPDEKRAAPIAQKILELQRDDGGWAQAPGMTSDAYATGQALFALVANSKSKNSMSCQRGIDFLLSTQEADGSWHVKTRSRPVQKYFDNGDPHGADQFISMAATSWATTALTCFSAIEPEAKLP